MLKNMVALVTGGAGSLGSATVRKLVREEGVKVVLMDLPNSQGQKIADEIGSGVLFSKGDVLDCEDVNKALNLAKSKFGKLNIIVNCAALHVSKVLYNFNKQTTSDLKESENVLKTNILGTMNVCRLGASILAENALDSNGLRGVVINTSGFSASNGQFGHVFMAASWGAVESMTMPMCREFCQVGVRVMTISPGLMDSTLMNVIPDKVKKGLETATPAPKRLGKPEEYAMLVKSIIENPFLNGEVIKLDGGLRFNLS